MGDMEEIASSTCPLESPIGICRRKRGEPCPLQTATGDSSIQAELEDLESCVLGAEERIRLDSRREQISHDKARRELAESRVTAHKVGIAVVVVLALIAVSLVVVGVAHDELKALLGGGAVATASAGLVTALVRG